MAEWNPEANALFLEALNRPAGPMRTDFLNQVCDHDEPLKSQVVALLEASDEAGEFLLSPAEEFRQTTLGRSRTDAVPSPSARTHTAVPIDGRRQYRYKLPNSNGGDLRDGRSPAGANGAVAGHPSTEGGPNSRKNLWRAHKNILDADGARNLAAATWPALAPKSLTTQGISSNHDIRSP